MKAIGFEYSSMKKKVKIPTKKFVSPKKKIEFIMKDHMSHHPAQHVYPHNRGNKNSYLRCHHYGIFGHISPLCYRLYGYPHSLSQYRINRKKWKKTQAKKVWNLRKRSLVS